MSHNLAYRHAAAADFKPPMEAPSGGGQPQQPSNPKKRRKTSSAGAGPQQQQQVQQQQVQQQQQGVSVQDLLPPPPTGYGDTVVASNPFDDSHTVHQHVHAAHAHHHHHHMRPHPHPHHHMPPFMRAGSPMNSPQPISPMMGPPQHSPRGVNGNGPRVAPPPSFHHQHQQQQQQHHQQQQQQMHPLANMMSMPMASPMFGGPKPMPVSAGKVYPPDQPMVFNPQNPNAPPIYPCGVCHKEVHDNDQAILCESGCNFWFHRGCTGLTEPAFQLLTQEVYAEWVCDKCLSSKNIPLVKFKP